MAERFLFFNSIEGDRRKYKAQDFAEYFATVLSTGFIHTDEVPGMRVSVESGTMKTVVSPGAAIMKGHWYKNTSDLTLEHPIPESDMDRVDRVVLRLDLRNQSRFIKLFVKEGTPATEPDAPELQRDELIYELSLAKVLIRKNTSSISENDITDERYYEEYGGFVNSMLTIPTDQFIEEWHQFLAERNEEFEAASGDFSDQMEHFQNQWDDWLYDIQSDTFARVVDKQSGKVYKLILDDEELFLEEV